MTIQMVSYSKNYKHVEELENISILDITPTIVKIMEVSLERDGQANLLFGLT